MAPLPSQYQPWAHLRMMCMACPSAAAMDAWAAGFEIDGSKPQRATMTAAAVQRMYQPIPDAASPVYL